MNVLESKTVSIAISIPFEKVYAFLSVPENFPKWASGLGALGDKEGDVYQLDAADGSMTVRFTPENAFGVADHTVISEDGVETLIPLRAVRNGDGTEVMITHFRTPLMSDEKFAADREWVERDLGTLREVLEAMEDGH